MPINREGEMFEPVKKYFKKFSNCLGSIETFGYDSHKGIPFYICWELKMNNYYSNPDVYGIGRDLA